MASSHWIKLYTEILHDPKMGRLPDHLWRRAVEIFLLAGEKREDGYLPSTADMAWTLRCDDGDILECLSSLEELGIVRHEDERWLVVNFARRQGPSPVSERVRRWRARRNAGDVTERYTPCNNDVTKRYTECNAQKIPEAESEEEAEEETESESEAEAEAKPRAAKMPAAAAAAVAVKSQSKREKEALEAITRVGIAPTPQVLELIAARDYITAEYVQYHAQRLEKARRFSTGLLITALKCGDPLPRADDRSRYISGKFAEYVEH